MTVLFFFCFFKKLFKVINWDSKLMPTLIILFVNSGETLDGEIKVISLYFLASTKSSWLIGPIITLAPSDLISCIAAFNFSLLLNPASLGMM